MLDFAQELLSLDSPNRKLIIPLSDQKIVQSDDELTEAHRYLIVLRMRQILADNQKLALHVLDQLLYDSLMQEEKPEAYSCMWHWTGSDVFIYLAGRAIMEQEEDLDFEDYFKTYYLNGKKLSTRIRQLFRWMGYKLDKKISDPKISALCAEIGQQILNLNYALFCTNHIWWNNGAFGDAKSCYWGEFWWHKEALNDSDVDDFHALLFYKSDGLNLRATGRCWVFYDAENDNYLFTNFYGLTPQQGCHIIQKYFGIELTDVKDISNCSWFVSEYNDHFFFADEVYLNRGQYLLKNSKFVFPNHAPLVASYEHLREEEDEEEFDDEAYEEEMRIENVAETISEYQLPLF